MPDVFKVDYFPDFTRLGGGTFRWFQVLFAVGPGDDATVREQVHLLFEGMLPTISDMSIVRKAEQVSLRARRRVPESPCYHPDNPVMFIEAFWHGSALAAMRDRGDFSTWASECFSYVNRLDPHDPLTRSYASQTTT
jgi:hypothetical protein